MGAVSNMASQNKALRKVAGGYKASLIRYLEAEMGVPPLDLYMEQRKCAFERRLEASGLSELLEHS